MQGGKLIAFMKWIGKAIIAGIISLIILSVFSLFYQYSGIHIDNPSGTTDYTWLPRQLKSTMTEGFSWLRMDENGFNNGRWYKQKEEMAVLLMGASHMEGVNVPQSENTAALLCRNGINTYNIGISAHYIYTCINNIKSAADRYRPQKMIVIQTNDIFLNVEDMRQILLGEYEKIPSYDSGLLFYLQKIPAIKPIYKQLEDWISGEEKERQGAGVLPESSSEEYTEVLIDFLSYAKDAVSENGCKLAILYTPIYEITAEKEIVFSTDEAALRQFEEACRASDIMFIDMTDEFAAAYYDRNVLVYGFPNTIPGKGHLNEYGHRLLADKLEKVIME